MKSGPGPVNRIFGRTLVSTTLGIHPATRGRLSLVPSVCIYHQAERNSKGGYTRRVHCTVNFETTFGKRVSSAASTGNQRTVT